MLIFTTLAELTDQAGKFVVAALEGLDGIEAWSLRKSKAPKKKKAVKPAKPIEHNPLGA